MRRRVRLAWLAFLPLGMVSAASLASGPTDAPVPDTAAVAFFERDVRPILVERCQSCHGPAKSKADLRLDSRAAILAGGESGPAIVPGDPGDSLLIDAINYGDLHQMPPKSKLPDSEIATLTSWVAMGAPWPTSLAVADRGGSRPTANAKDADFDLRQRARHWSFQPWRIGKVPEVQDKGWPRTAIDGFILAALEARRLS